MNFSKKWDKELIANEIAMIIGGKCKYTFKCPINISFQDLCDFFLIYD